jgi:hypothetical protein
MGASLESVPEADVAIATLWVTAYAVAHFPHAKRKFYLVQDFEPMFYPASTLYALTEESYKLGLYGLCNTDNLRQIYEGDYAGKGMSFTPAVDPTVFHARGRVERMPEDPATVFVYARPGHWRNCWELASLALEELKDKLGDRVRIVTAGSWAVPEGGFGGMHHYGLLDYRATGELYRTCDVGMALTVSKHPSYLPLELMACGVPVVAVRQPVGPLGARGRQEQPARQAHRRRPRRQPRARGRRLRAAPAPAHRRARDDRRPAQRLAAGAVRHLPLPLQPRGTVGGALRVAGGRVLRHSGSQDTSPAEPLEPTWPPLRRAPTTTTTTSGTSTRSGAASWAVCWSPSGCWASWTG